MGENESPPSASERGSEDEPSLPDLLAERKRARPLWVTVSCFAGAFVLFVAGIAGWLIPVVTGIPFYVAGLALLGVASPRARHWINRLERRLPTPFRWRLRRGLRKIPFKKLRAVVRIPKRFPGEDEGGDDRRLDSDLGGGDETPERVAEGPASLRGPPRISGTS